MIDKKFLAPILVLTAIGLPLKASVATYCDSGCGGFTIAAFNSIVTTNMLTYAYGADQIFTGSLTGGNTHYTDGLTNLAFQDVNMFTITGSNGLEAVGTHDTILFSIPSTFSAVRITLLASTTGAAFFTCFNAGCDGGNISSSTPTTIGYITDTPGTAWNFQISASSADQIIVSSFNAAGDVTASDTPEVGTLLLIGFGLIAMRWMPRVPRLFFRTLRTA